LLPCRRLGKSSAVISELEALLLRFSDATGIHIEFFARPVRIARRGLRIPVADVAAASQWRFVVAAYWLSPLTIILRLSRNVDSAVGFSFVLSVCCSRRRNGDRGDCAWNQSLDNCRAFGHSALALLSRMETPLLVSWLWSES